MKNKEDKLTMEFLESLEGKFVHSPTNIVEGENNWFAGPVIGCGVYKIFNPDTIIYNIILGDGTVRTLAEDCEMVEMTAEEFVQFVKDEEKRQREEKEALAIKKKILGTSSPGSIII